MVFTGTGLLQHPTIAPLNLLSTRQKLPATVSKLIHQLTQAKSLRTSDNHSDQVLEHEFVQIQPLAGPPAHITSDVSIPFLSTFMPIAHDLLAPQPSVQSAPPRTHGRPKGIKSYGSYPVPGSEILKVQRPVGRPRGSGHRQREAAAQAAERAALGLVQTQIVQKRRAGWPKKDKEDSNSVFVEFRAVVSLLTLYFCL